DRSSKSIALKLRPAAFSVPEKLLSFLRHELYHIHDMLDPAFGYDPALPDCQGEPARLKLFLNRYRVLCDTLVDGRLFESGKAAEGTKARRQKEFLSAFSLLGEKALQAFEEWFCLPRPAHAALIQFARNPCGRSGTGSVAEAGICPLCKCSSKLE